MLGDISLASLDLEIDYSEKKESEVIRQYLIMEIVKPKFRKILGNMRSQTLFPQKGKKFILASQNNFFIE